MTQNQEETQNPEGEQFYAEENKDVRAEPEYAWDPYQTQKSALLFYYPKDYFFSISPVVCNK